MQSVGKKIRITIFDHFLIEYSSVFKNLVKQDMKTIIYLNISLCPLLHSWSTLRCIYDRDIFLPAGTEIPERVMKYWEVEASTQSCLVLT